MVVSLGGTDRISLFGQIMAFLKRLLQGSSRNKKKDYPNITSGADPLEKWRKIGELGDGAFGTVFKVKHGFCCVVCVLLGGCSICRLNFLRSASGAWL